MLREIKGYRPSNFLASGFKGGKLMFDGLRRAVKSDLATAILDQTGLSKIPVVNHIIDIVATGLGGAGDISDYFARKIEEQDNPQRRKKK